MTKKSFNIDDEEDEFAAPLSEMERITKMPIDTTGAAKNLIGFQEIPVTMLHPFTLKNGTDFSRHNKVLSHQFVESIKDVGIIDALIVRASPQQMGMYEIIAGESRWEHAKEAGLTTVPCRVMNLADEKASSIFNITNLMRRDLTVRDRINGWYAFYMCIKDKGTAIDDLERTVEEEQKGVMALVGGKGLTLRSVQRYVKMHNLIEDWLVRLDNDVISLRLGYHIAFFPDEIQQKLLAYKVTEHNLVRLRDIYEGKNPELAWSDDLIEKSLELNLLKEWAARITDDNRQIMVRVAILPKALQEELLAYNVDESKLAWLYNVYVGNDKEMEWSSHIISDNFERLSVSLEGRQEEQAGIVKRERIRRTKEERKQYQEEQARVKLERAYKKVFKAITPKLIDAARTCIRPDDYGRSDEILQQALKLYYEQTRP